MEMHAEYWQTPSKDEIFQYYFIEYPLLTTEKKKQFRRQNYGENKKSVIAAMVRAVRNMNKQRMEKV